MKRSKPGPGGFVMHEAGDDEFPEEEVYFDESADDPPQPEPTEEFDSEPAQAEAESDIPLAERPLVDSRGRPLDQRKALIAIGAVIGALILLALIYGRYSVPIVVAFVFLLAHLTQTALWERLMHKRHSLGPIQQKTNIQIATQKFAFAAALVWFIFIVGLLIAPILGWTDFKVIFPESNPLTIPLIITLVLAFASTGFPSFSDDVVWLSRHARFNAFFWLLSGIMTLFHMRRAEDFESVRGFLAAYCFGSAVAFFVIASVMKKSGANDPLNIRKHRREQGNAND